VRPPPQRTAAPRVGSDRAPTRRAVPWYCVPPRR
jgi:hypothetical protein